MTKEERAVLIRVRVAECMRNPKDKIDDALARAYYAAQPIVAPPCLFEKLRKDGYVEHDHLGSFKLTYDGRKAVRGFLLETKAKSQ